MKYKNVQDCETSTGGEETSLTTIHIHEEYEPELELRALTFV